MKVNIQKLTKRFVPLLSVCVILLGCMVVPSFAAGWEDTNITIVDYLDYADNDHVEVDSNQSYVVIDIPATFTESVFVRNDGTIDSFFTDGPSDTVEIPDGGNKLKYLCFPTLDYHYTENRTRDGYLFDTSNFPDGTTISWEWTVEFIGNVSITNPSGSFDYFCYFFNPPDVKAWSYRGGRTDIFGLPAYADTNKIVAYCEYTHGAPTIGTVTNYVAPCIRFQTLEFSRLPITLIVNTSSVKVTIPITDELLDFAQSEKTNKLLNEVNRQLEEQGKTMDDILAEQELTNDKLDGVQDSLDDTNDKLDGVQDSLDDTNDKLDDANEKLDDVIGGTPEMNNKVDSAVDDMNNAGDQLGDLGESLNAVEKPNTENLNVGINSFLPETSFLAYTAPIRNLWENDTLVGMLIIVLTLVLVSWVFFGKKG